METTFGKTVETKRLKSHQNRSNCSLANLDALNANSENINKFLANFLLETNTKNNNDYTYKLNKSNSNIYDSNSMIQFDTQLERINNELARAQLMTQLTNNCHKNTTTNATINNTRTNFKEKNSGYLSDSEFYANKLPSRLKIINRNDSAFDRNSKNNNQLDYNNLTSKSNMKSSCINMQSAFKENNQFLLDNNNRLHSSNLCLKLNRFNNIIDNNNNNNKCNNDLQSKQKQHQNYLNILKQKKNEYYYNLIKTNQFNKLNNKTSNSFVNNNRSFRLNNSNNQSWMHNNNMNYELNYFTQLLSPAVRSKINHRRSDEALSVLDKQLIKETNIDECIPTRNDYDCRNYLTWKNFNCNPELNRQYYQNKINFEEELNQLKLKFRNKYYCDEYSIRPIENVNNDVDKDDLFDKKHSTEKSMSMPDTPLLYNSYTLPKHSRLNEYNNTQAKLECKNNQEKIEVVSLENALLSMNEILKNLTLNSSSKRVNEFNGLKLNYKEEEEAEFLIDDKTKELSPPLSTSTSISLSPPPPPYNHHSQINHSNQLSMSPSLSLSSSSYVNSSKSSSTSTSPCEPSESLSEKSDHSKSSDHFFDFSITNLNQITKSLNQTEKKSIKVEKTEHVSLGKKLKRFLSLNSGSNNTFKKKLFQLH